MTDAFILVGKPGVNGHSEDQGLDGRIILKMDYRERGVGVDWINLAQNRDQWRAVVNTVMNLRDP
jgi:hypothetical protein